MNIFNPRNNLMQLFYCINIMGIFLFYELADNQCFFYFLRYVPEPIVTQTVTVEAPPKKRVGFSYYAEVVHPDGVKR